MYRILIADDEMIEREAVKYIINQNFPEKFEVCEAGNGKEALEKAAAFKPEIVFFDIKMPGINGLDAASQIRSFFPGCRIILISAYSYFNYAKDAVALGADDYITKPAPPEKIVETLEKAVAFIDENAARKKKELETDLRLRQITQYLEEEFITLLVSGEVEEKVIRNYFEVLNINCGTYMTAAISVFRGGYSADISSDVQKTIIKKRLMDKIRDKLQTRGYSVLIGSINQEVYLLIASDLQKDDYDARLSGIRLFSEIRDEIFYEMQMNINCGIGNRCTEVDRLSNAFLQAKISLKYDVTPGTVTSYGDIYKESIKVQYPVNKEKLLHDALIEGNERKYSLLLDEILDWMVINITDLDSLKQKTYELLLVIIRDVTVNSSFNEIYLDTEELRKTLFLMDTTREIRLFAKKYIDKKMQEINKIKMTSVRTVMSTVIEYLQENYEKDISLEYVAEMVKITPFYLSKLFKQETGENFIDFLTEIRIKKAKELLADPLNNVKDVCYQVGYRHPNYFTRVFKKTCGVTPTEFKFKIVT